ncbi:DUF1810 domain-containing protein [Phycicoccus sp. BSK3Z-2]|uniref:DUF1810 domain-containing protein n=1 Tax=Phycicoccus avicenniae TaxID=2828860 RepID=A0A941I0E2_9MICO|nr:DUF1810 domain-containing protein [Phycicoccus avicenniae]MBR7743825.1 DUF1810 domain-containing protein [Phycicoccus avicenniae]
MEHDLSRFVDAQDRGGTYDQALRELRSGHKTGHWIWFVLPQVSGLGRSATSQAYGLDGLDEARAYLAHPVLGPRLRECCEALLGLEGSDATAVLGPVDAVKLRSSMTVFLRASVAGGGDGQPFRAVLDRYFGGEEDPHTLDRL